MKKLRAIFINKKHFCNNLAFENLVATFLAKLFFQGIFFFLKLIGGIKSFASSKIAVAKWCLNRGDQAKNTSSLKELAEIEKVKEVNKSLRPSQISSSEKKVQKVMEVLLDEYINPFRMDLDKEKLLNLSSGTPVDDAVAEILLHVYNNGNIQA